MYRKTKNELYASKPSKVIALQTDKSKKEGHSTVWKLVIWSKHSCAR